MGTISASTGSFGCVGSGTAVLLSRGHSDGRRRPRYAVAVSLVRVRVALVVLLDADRVRHGTWRSRMTVAAATAHPAQAPGWTAVTRIAPTGVPVELALPEVFGVHRWYANTRFTGPGLARQFFLAPAGEHRAVPTHVLPGARERRVPVRGFDALVFEAPDRRDSALVLAARTTRPRRGSPARRRPTTGWPACCRRCGSPTRRAAPPSSRSPTWSSHRPTSP
ncbi:hypothetical protein BJF78_18325 [Pseudonocardia sp. CNS-139]|nr:hypothetical protein BJF78_18325 [Pseudonocardia sp. CNS-139]